MAIFLNSITFNFISVITTSFCKRENLSINDVDKSAGAGRKKKMRKFLDNGFKV